MKHTCVIRHGKTSSRIRGCCPYGYLVPTEKACLSAHVVVVVAAAVVAVVLAVIVLVIMVVVIGIVVAVVL